VRTGRTFGPWLPLRDKRAIITGASEGIGRALALALAKRGVHVALLARGLERLEAVAEECRRLGVSAYAIQADVSLEEDCRRMIELAIRSLGGLDILVNNAGIGMWAEFRQVQDLGIYERLMRVNYLSSVWATHAALESIIARQGLIVAISSLTGKTGVPTRSGYAASKHAMQGFFDSIRIELEPLGVAVSVISPGFVATDIRAKGFGADGQARGESPRAERDGDTMSVEECVGRIVQAIERREREVVMTAKAKAGLWLKLVAPGLVDRIARKAVREKGDA
jgi:short-subunit dehydrogenase